MPNETGQPWEMCGRHEEKFKAQEQRFDMNETRMDKADARMDKTEARWLAVLITLIGTLGGVVANLLILLGKK